MFLRIKPIKKLNKKSGEIHTYYYVYEVESYKIRGKTKQKTIGLIGRYIQLKKKYHKKYPIEKVLQTNSKETLFKEILALQLENYGFKQIKPQVYKLEDIIANLKNLRVFSESSNKDVYINLNNKFFGTKTLRRAIKTESSDLLDFVRAIVDAGLIDISFLHFKKAKNYEKLKNHDFKLLQAIINKFYFSLPEKEIPFEKFREEIGY
jgi:hypothetical protein